MMNDIEVLPGILVLTDSNKHFIIHSFIYYTNIYEASTMCQSIMLRPGGSIVNKTQPLSPRIVQPFHHELASDGTYL